MKSKFLLTSLVLALLSPNAQAATTVAAQPCDAAYWQSMSSRAWLETEREIMQNQNLIFKPDSVLEYTCFDSLVDHTAKYVGDIFSHTNYFGEMIIDPTSQYGMRQSLENAIAIALQVYNDTNYSHKFLGARGEFVTLTPADHEFDGRTRTGAYSCGVMAAVWKASKCMNFVHSSDFEETDGFYPFNALKNASGATVIGGYKDTIKETRKFPTACSGATSALGSWGNNITRATNTNLSGNDVLYQFKTPLKAVFTDVYNKTSPNAPGNCGYAVPTGVTVYTKAKPAGYPDGVCTKPGCTYTAENNAPTATTCALPSTLPPITP